ncbi:TlpA family protein disulfide reductase [Chryseobacterium camelliae]|uniref:TlpA family protein disulfide reductase n=1 Tax=Chryseobacterium camelliae TaxID=1265445 RepID=UPI00285E80C7|nr:TlpA disulfide reductase family protein [Chryseobacterium camelliae]MDR6513682.1 thiol-disulfide isomerase/thioredoxin [Chryseobacterium camelliae]
MKRQILTIIFTLFLVSIYGQIKTTVSGFLPDFSDSEGKVEVHITYPFVIGTGHKVVYNPTLQFGKFEFEINLTEPVSFSLTLNDNPLFFPGTFSSIISPGDSIRIVVPDSKKLGLLNIEFSGKGSEKINFQKAIVAVNLLLYKNDPDYAEQSLEYKFKSTDIKLDAIDSLYKNYNAVLPLADRNLVRAREYASVLDNLLISALNSDSPSLRSLFRKYLVKKNRMLPLYEDNCIYYDANFLPVRDYILLSEYKNPHKFGGNMFRKLSPVKYCGLIVKHMQKEPLIKEYLLSDAVLNVFAREQDSENSRKVLQIYSDNVKHDSPFYNQVLDAFQAVQSRLKRGMTFYNFSLPDTSGKKHNLDDFEGKVLILDFWFNGCAGCGQMAPVLDSLEQQLKYRDIQFLSISIDRNEKLWRAGIGRYSAKNSLQLFTEGLEMKHPLLKYLNPRGFPFLVAVDKRGNLIGIPPDPRLDKDKFLRFIDKYF